MSKIKICGLSRPCDIDYVNEAKPDFCGFIIGVPKSRRNVTPDTVRSLTAGLSPDIAPVGVFVNAPMEEIAALTSDGTLSYVQLHGQEDERYLAALRKAVKVPIIQAFKSDLPGGCAPGGAVLRRLYSAGQRLRRHRAGLRLVQPSGYHPALYSCGRPRAGKSR